MKAILLNLFLLIILTNLNGQRSIIFEKGLGFGTKHVTPSIAEQKLKKLYNFDYEELIQTFDQSHYYLSLSSALLYSLEDSAVHYFWKAYSIDPRAICSIMPLIHKTHKTEISTGEKDSSSTWYLMDLEDLDEEGFINDCEVNYPRKETNKFQIEPTPISRLIRSRDEIYRRGDGWDKRQSNFDVLNQNYIDSLFNIEHSLNPYTLEEIWEFSLVTHHAADCAWVFKWIDRFFYHIEYNEYAGKMLLEPMLSRMILKEDSRCTSINATSVHNFMERLSILYPKTYKKILHSDN